MIESEALTEWLGDRKNRPLEDIARKCNVDPLQFRELASRIYTQCVDVAVSYQSYNENGLTHSKAASNKGVDFLIYVLFRKKYEVFDEKSEEGLMQAEGLKRNDLYDPGIGVIKSSRKKLTEEEMQIVKALYNFYNGYISGNGKGILSCCRFEGFENYDLIPKFMRQNKLMMPKKKEEAQEYLNRLDELVKE